MRITLEELIAHLEQGYEQAEEIPEEECTEAFDNNAAALRRLLTNASNGGHFNVAYAVITYANTLSINLTAKA